ncbi:MAG: DEAD/DEAH box helicase [Paludibaculum sp.]
MAGQDVLGIAQTGTGKTAAFTLPMIDKLSAGRAKARMPRALVVAPTRRTGRPGRRLVRALRQGNQALLGAADRRRLLR